MMNPLAKLFDFLLGEDDWLVEVHTPEEVVVLTPVVRQDIGVVVRSAGLTCLWGPRWVIPWEEIQRVVATRGASQRVEWTRLVEEG